MATRRREPEIIPLVAEGVARPRLHKIRIRNFRSIGPAPVEIELDDIVVLVGPNNCGKSSILRAYQIVMSHGSAEGRLTINDFPDGKVDSDNLPAIELETIVFDRAPGERWIGTTDAGEMLIRERWVWDSPNKEPTRCGYDVEKADWDDQVPWGAPNIANARRPRAHRIDAFASPDAQAAEITKLITDLLKGKLATIKSDPHQEKSDYEMLLDSIRDLQAKAAEATEGEIKIIEEAISRYIERIFPAHKIKFDAKAENDLDKAYTPFKSSADLLMGPDGGYFSNIAHQGSGARRTLLWATLKYLAERGDMDGARPHVLLLDEPEICLHPSAIREARSVLYNLPESGHWQVMITTHSPIFIDLSRDNTTVVRVFRDDDSAVKSTTLYRPTRARLDEDDKRNMKLLNICDPYLHEFFFGGRQVIVEGDTEYTAFSMLRDLYPDRYSDVQIIRARGKGIIPSVAKVLLQFSKGFSVLHDTDTEFTANGNRNPAWGMNQTIREIRELENATDRVNLVACKTCFETALFGVETRAEKPYAALMAIRSDKTVEERVRLLLDALLDVGIAPPENCIRWDAIEQLV